MAATIRGSMTLEFSDQNLLRMEREALEDARGCQCRIDESTSPPLDLLEPGIEVPCTTISTNVKGPTRTPTNIKGSSLILTGTKTDSVWYGGRDILYKDTPSSSQAQQVQQS